MKTLRETAQAYEPQQTKNIADLEEVDVSLDLLEKTSTDKEGKPFMYSYIKVQDEEYRVPVSVIKQLKKHLEIKPSMKSFRVLKEGEKMNTEYTVIPLDLGDVGGKIIP